MATIDPVGNIHDRQGRFDGHLRSDAETTLTDEPSAATYEPIVYRIPTSRLAALQAKLDKLNRRLAKAGIEETFAYDARPRIVHDERTGASHETNDVTINTPRISLGDWRFDSMHEKAANGKVISHFAGDTDPHIADETMRCDYCGHNRARTKVYVVTSPSTGETTQVGSNCLELFLGVKPAGLWVLDESFDASEFDVDDEDLGARYGQDTRITPGDNVMLLTMRQIEQDGGVFLSRGRATIYDTPTADKVLDAIEHGAAGGHLEASAAEADELRRLYAWVDELEGESEYERNLLHGIPTTVLARTHSVHRRVPAEGHWNLVAIADEELLVGLPDRREGDELADRELFVGSVGRVSSAGGVGVAILAEVAVDDDVGEGTGQRLSSHRVTGVERVESSKRDGHVLGDGRRCASREKPTAVGRDRLPPSPQDRAPRGLALSVDQRLGDRRPRHPVERDSLGHDDVVHGCDVQPVDTAEVGRIEPRSHRLHRRHEVLEERCLLFRELLRDRSDPREVDVLDQAIGVGGEARLGGHEVLQGIAVDDRAHLRLDASVGCNQLLRHR